MFNIFHALSPVPPSPGITTSISWTDEISILTIHGLLPLQALVASWEGLQNRRERLGGVNSGETFMSHYNITFSQYML
jgi:hypothetical protein